MLDDLVNNFSVLSIFLFLFKHIEDYIYLNTLQLLIIKKNKMSPPFSLSRSINNEEKRKRKKL